MLISLTTDGDTGGAGIWKYVFQKDGEDWKTFTTDPNTTSNAVTLSGEHTFTLFVYDKAGNVSNLASYTIIYDDTAPTLDVYILGDPTKTYGQGAARCYSAETFCVNPYLQLPR